MSRRRTVRPPAVHAPVVGPRGASWGARVAALVILVAGAAAYANSLSNPLMMDDRRAIVENPQIRTLWPLSVALDPPDDTPVARRPLVNLSFAINYAVHGFDVRGFHVANLLIHLCAGLVLFGLVRRACTLPRLRASFGAGAVALASAAALLWTLHPLHTEIVNYVSQRTTALMGLCYLLTLYCSVRAIDSTGGRWHVGAVAACAAGMACKESMVTAPVLVALFDRAFVFGSWREGWHRRWLLYVGLVSTWLLLGALMASGARTTVGFHGDVGAWPYLLSQAPIVLRYFRLVVWPTGMVADYGPAQAVTLPDVLLPALTVAALVAVCLIGWWRRPRAAFLPLASFLLLAPTSSIVPILTEVGAERRMYLPAATLLILALSSLYRAAVVLRTYAPSSSVSRVATPGRAVATVAVAVVCVVFLALIVERNREFDTPLGLARTSLDRWPHGRSHLRVANELLTDGRREEALWHMRQATQDYPDAHYALGTELIVGGDLDAGVRELRSFIEHRPEHAYVQAARQTIGTALALQQRYDEAAREFRVLLETSGSTAELHAYMGEVLLRGSGDPSEAVTHLEQAAARRPGDARIRNLLGTALAIVGDYDRAREHLMTAVRIDPGYEPARAGLMRLERMKQDSSSSVE